VTFDEVESMLEGVTMGERFVRKYATWADAFEDKGRQEGLQQGRALAREETLARLRAILMRQLHQRFGEVPAAMAARIDCAAEPDLERWMVQVIDAQSVQGLLEA
jgi:predicted transposase YdaD